MTLPTFSIFVILLLLTTQPCKSDVEEHTVIVIPSGGITKNGEMKPWVRTRLDVSASEYESSRSRPKIFVLSRGTTWKPPPLDFSNRPIDESSVSMRYLVQNHSIPVEDVFEENVSMDTIGNAFFLRVMHLDIMFPPDSIVNMIVVTNSFHMLRVRTIFQWIFEQIPSRNKYRLKYIASEDAGMDAEVLRLREIKEKASAKRLQENLIPRIRTIRELHSFMYREHDAYRSECVVSPVSCFEDTYTCHLDDDEDTNGGSCSTVSKSY